ncbi:MAG: tRNA dihydrouridine synthase DusB [Planctomycetota bacterium]|nr:MAG: tRNA dihydrouridine synthase DusB [Planctomycetota bacterium]
MRDSSYITERNQGVAPARPGEFAPLRLSAGIELGVPVVLAPMAGVTGAPFRVLCREFGEAIYVGEMITARGLCNGNAKTRHLASFHPSESPRSLQLYGTNPKWLEEAARILIAEHGVDHIDINLGCPVRKVTASGGGAAIPYRPRLMARLLRALKRGAGTVPVTVKMRLGIDAEHLTYLEAGRVAEGEGMAWVGLHARTAEQLYDGEADWTHIAELQSLLNIPVLGNGDIWEARDALRMMRETACAGVIVGRACLGRPWLFAELESLFSGQEPAAPPRFAEIRRIALRHAELLRDWYDERIASLHMRKFASWYTQCFPGARKLKDRMQRVQSINELALALESIPDEEPFPFEGLRVRRCKKAGRQKVSLPPAYLDDPDADTAPEEEIFVEGG